ncbi:hypothetical protein AAFN88_12695 [Pelagibius sp. CAU 1746]|uniref:hypothetical protein n=1 Tax=Pelagibius sp. CAU 1746 TaxID=3140370 RepID=UPI00325BF67E
MEYFGDLYGVRADQETFIKREEEVVDRVAERVMEVLDVEMHGSISDSRGGICWDIDLPPKAADGDENRKELLFLIDVHLAPNRIIEPDDDYWLEEDYQEFAWLLTVGSCRRERIEETRKAIAAAKDLDLTLIRSTYDKDLGPRGGPPTVTFSLKSEPEEE